MSGVEKQFSSAVKFLASVRPLSEYDELETRQVTGPGLVSSLEKVARLTPAQATSLLTSCGSGKPVHGCTDKTKVCSGQQDTVCSRCEASIHARFHTVAFFFNDQAMAIRDG